MEKFPFTNKKSEIQQQLLKPIDYAMTSLHDALMEAASSLVRQGSQTPVRMIILFTNGYDTSSTIFADRANFLSSFTNLVKAHHIADFAVGLSEEQDQQLLRGITDSSLGIPGMYVQAPDFSKFEQGLNQVQLAINSTV